jgi:hypothetical protein
MADLGAVLGTHPARLAPKLAATVLSAGLTIATIWFAVASSAFAWIAVAVFAVITAVLAMILVRATSQVVTRHEHGVACKVGGTEQQIRFDRITKIDTWTLRGKPLVFVLELEGGEQARVPLDVRDHETLIAHVCRERA